MLEEVESEADDDVLSIRQYTIVEGILRDNAGKSPPILDDLVPCLAILNKDSILLRFGHQDSWINGCSK